MYEFVTGPLAWLAFGIFFVGIVVRLVLYVRGLDWKLDRVTYSVNTSYGVKGAVRSIVYWLMPFGTHSWRNNPMLTLRKPYPPIFKRRPARKTLMGAGASTWASGNQV